MASCPSLLFRSVIVGSHCYSLVEFLFCPTILPTLPGCVFEHGRPHGCVMVYYCAFAFYHLDGFGDGIAFICLPAICVSSWEKSAQVLSQFLTGLIFICFVLSCRNSLYTLGMIPWLHVGFSNVFFFSISIWIVSFATRNFQFLCNPTCSPFLWLAATHF